MLDIDGIAHIRTPNPRNELHGEQVVKAVDVPVVVHVLAAAGAVLDALRLDQLELWGPHGDPILDELDLRLRHKLTNKIARFSLDDVTVELRDCELKNMTLTGLPGNALELEFKVQSRVTAAQFIDLWTLSGEGECGVRITDLQMDLGLAAAG